MYCHTTYLNKLLPAIYRYALLPFVSPSPLSPLSLSLSPSLPLSPSPLLLCIAHDFQLMVLCRTLLHSYGNLLVKVCQVGGCQVSSSLLLHLYAWNMFRVWNQLPLLLLSCFFTPLLMLTIGWKLTNFRRFNEVSLFIWGHITIVDFCWPAPSEAMTVSILAIGINMSQEKSHKSTAVNKSQLGQHRSTIVNKSQQWSTIANKTAM